MGRFVLSLEQGRKETEKIVEEIKEKEREERGTGMKIKKKKTDEINLFPPSTFTCYKDSRPCYQLNAPVT